MSESRITARFSPGRWWGFNGVDDLELSDGILTRRHFRIFGRRAPTTHNLASIKVISREVRTDKRSGRAAWLRMTVDIDGSRKIFTGHVEGGEPFAAALTRLTAR